MLKIISTGSLMLALCCSPAIAADPVMMSPSQAAGEDPIVSMEDAEQVQGGDLQPGTVLTALPRNCSAVRTSNATYHNCDGTYFLPQMEGNKTVYVVVEKP